MKTGSNINRNRSTFESESVTCGIDLIASLIKRNGGVRLILLIKFIMIVYLCLKLHL